MGPEYVAPYDRPPLLRYTGQTFIQAPHLMHFKDSQNLSIESLLLRPLSVKTICISDPFLGPEKCEVYCVAGVPSALLDNNLMNTPKSSFFGRIFSIPILAICSGGMLAVRSALP